MQTLEEYANSWTTDPRFYAALRLPGVTCVGRGYALFDLSLFKADQLPAGFLWADYQRLPGQTWTMLRAAMDIDKRYNVGHWPQKPGPEMRQPGAGLVCTCEMCMPGLLKNPYADPYP